MSTETEASFSRGWCLFHSEGLPYAVKIGSVAEVVRVERLVRLPFAHPRLVGLCTLRRNVIPVFRLRADDPRLPMVADGNSLVLLIRAMKGTWGLLADRERLQVHENLSGATRQSGREREPDHVLRDGEQFLVVDPDAAWDELLIAMRSWYASRTPGTLDLAPG